MIVKQIKGKGFLGCLKYVMEKAGAIFIEGNVDAFSTIANAARDFRLNCEANPRVKRVVYHATLSVPSEDKGKLNDIEWGDVARSFLAKMKFCSDFDDPNVPKVPYIVVRHTDRDHEHIHIVAGRVRTDGTCVSDSWDYRWGEKAVRELEVEFGLSQPFTQINRESPHPYLVEKLEKIYALDSKAEDKTPEAAEITPIPQNDPIAQEVERILEYRRQRREQAKNQSVTESSPLIPQTQDTPKPQEIPKTLPALITQVSQQVKNIPEFLKTLKEKGIEATIRLTRNRCVQGIIYHHEGLQISGTSLGAAFTFPGLRKRLGLDFDSKLHLTEIEKHNQTCQPIPQQPKLLWLQEIATSLDNWLTKNQKQQYQNSDFQAYRDKDWLVIRTRLSDVFFKARYDSQKREWLPQSGWRLDPQTAQILRDKLSTLSTTSERVHQAYQRKR